MTVYFIYIDVAKPHSSCGHIIIFSQIFLCINATPLVSLVVVVFVVVMPSLPFVINFEFKFFSVTASLYACTMLHWRQQQQHDEREKKRARIQPQCNWSQNRMSGSVTLSYNNTHNESTLFVCVYIYNSGLYVQRSVQRLVILSLNSVYERTNAIASQSVSGVWFTTNKLLSEFSNVFIFFSLLKTLNSWATATDRIYKSHRIVNTITLFTK